MQPTICHALVRDTRGKFVDKTYPCPTTQAPATGAPTEDTLADTLPPTQVTASDTLSPIIEPCPDTLPPTVFEGIPDYSTLAPNLPDTLKPTVDDDVPSAKASPKPVSVGWISAAGNPASQNEDTPTTTSSPTLYTDVDVDALGTKASKAKASKVTKVSKHTRMMSLDISQSYSISAPASSTAGVKAASSISGRALGKAGKVLGKITKHSSKSSKKTKKKATASAPLKDTKTPANSILINTGAVMHTKSDKEGTNEDVKLLKVVAKPFHLGKAAK